MTDAAAPIPIAPVKKPNPFVGPAIVAAWIGLGVLLLKAPSGPAVFAFVMVGWIVAVMLHEFSHAAVAYLGGDHTVKDKGYLAFDPRRYGDLGVSLVMPVIFLLLGGIGFPGGAVYLRDDLMRGPVWRMAASLAGPAATALIFGVLGFGLSFWRGWGVGDATALFDALAMLAFLQAMALILNLLPIPGLDGFNAIRPFLPQSLNPQLRKAEGLAMAGLFLLLMFVPAFGGALFRAAAFLSAALGVPGAAISDGWTAFHFWQRP
jgi:Zn-dependent protease